MVTGGLAVVLFTAAAFLTFGHGEPGSSGVTSEHATRVAVEDVRWVPKWTAASARAVAATGEPTMDPRWLPKQYLEAALTSQAG
jgi:hypothetical protein